MHNQKKNEKRKDNRNDDINNYIMIPFFLMSLSSCHYHFVVHSIFFIIHFVFFLKYQAFAVDGVVVDDDDDNDYDDAKKNIKIKNVLT